MEGDNDANEINRGQGVIDYGQSRGICIGRGLPLTHNIDEIRKPRSDYLNCSDFSPRTEVQRRGLNDANARPISVPDINDLTPGIDQLKIESNETSSNLSINAPVFVPQFQYNIPPNFSGSESTTETSCQDDKNLQELPTFNPQMIYMNHPVILQVNDLVVKLTLKPQKYDQIAVQMTSILNWKISESNLLKEVISVIFEQGVGEANFRFNGGKLCHYLSRNVTSENPSFKSLLLKKCQEEYNCANYYLDTNVSRLVGFVLFLADIFCHLVTPEGQHQETLKGGLCELLLILLSRPKVETLKCVAQVLKCCGKYLDRNCPKMDEVVTLVRDVAVNTKTIPMHIQQMLLLVVELRAANWGQEVNQQTNEDIIGNSSLEQRTNLVSNHHSSSLLDERHLQQQQQDGTSMNNILRQMTNDDEYDDSSSDLEESFFGFCTDQGEEIDEEIARDFEEFLMNQNN